MQKMAVCCALALALVPAAVLADTPPDKKGHEHAMEMPKPAPEHGMLKQDVGTWDATVEMWMEPGKPPTTSKGTEVNTLGPGGFWLITSFKSEMMGAPFEGHGLTGYDPAKKVYVSTWVDSMGPGLSLGESTYDAKTRTVTGWMEGPGPDGKPMKMKSVVKYETDDKRVFSMSMPGPDGKDMTTMRITYNRRK
jgi:hypothetical protein